MYALPIKRRIKKKIRRTRSTSVRRRAMGTGGYNRLFVAGNPDYVNQDFVSDFTDGTQALPTYFPENMYAQIGQDNTKIIGYLRSGNELAILKEDNEQDATVFLRSATLKMTLQFFSR